MPHMEERFKFSLLVSPSKVPFNVIYKFHVSKNIGSIVEILCNFYSIPSSDDLCTKYRTN